MLSMKAKYALKALSYLVAQDTQRVQTGAIAQAENIPHKFLEAILTELRKNNIIDSKRGLYGGVRLARAPEKVTVGDIIRIIDGPLAMVPCASLTRYRPCEDCPDETSCRIRNIMIDARLALTEVLDQRTLRDLADAAPQHT
ncbi:RrF2 family transcriptional regulator [Luteithermobacter gelatinilyticus]|uniref:RrF2 family transcriptional regulator n=1 Tax=Luteithermobacter gelatinilyticus TaxID=2582913 RepID=UPI001106AE15|nr:Rrf2 family transcriptional regulator [Luteithermobacter gelatinilyticus]